MTIDFEKDRESLEYMDRIFNTLFMEGKTLLITTFEVMTVFILKSEDELMMREYLLYPEKRL